MLGIDDPTLARAADQIAEDDLVRRDVQACRRVQAINTLHVRDGVAGIDHLCRCHPQHIGWPRFPAP